MSITRTRKPYQEGSIERIARAKGPDVWVYRWREPGGHGRRVQRKRVIGDVEQYPTYPDAKRAADPLRIEANAAHKRTGKITVREAWEHFLANEIHNPEIDRSPTTIEVYKDNFRLHILPRWGETFLSDVKPVHVESWLRELPRARATKSKLRNNLSVVFSHAIRHEMFDRINPISSVRQSSKREKIPDVLTLDEMVAIVSGLDSQAHRLMVCIAGVTALRRSEIRGLKWRDVDTDRLWLHLRRGKVRKHQTKLKTEASRKGMTLSKDLADAFLNWRLNCLYRADDDWVFGSPKKNGREPLWLDAILMNYVRPAAQAAGINKHIGWHTFRRSVSSVLGSAGEKIKVVSELLRHANISTTSDLYQQAYPEEKRAAQERMKPLFAA